MFKDGQNFKNLYSTDLRVPIIKLYGRIMWAVGKNCEKIEVVPNRIQSLRIYNEYRLRYKLISLSILRY